MESATPTALFPRPTVRGEESRYFDDLTTHRLPLYRCSRCGRADGRPYVRCPACGGDQVVREWSSGRGRLYSYTTLHRAGHPAFADRVPYVIALVDLEEGFRSLADLREAGTEPPIGLAVLVGFDSPVDGLVLPHFRPAPDEPR